MPSVSSERRGQSQSQQHDARDEEGHFAMIHWLLRVVAAAQRAERVEVQTRDGEQGKQQ
jgi:hypothetical protein